MIKIITIVLFFVSVLVLILTVTFWLRSQSESDLIDVEVGRGFSVCICSIDETIIFRLDRRPIGTGEPRIKTKHAAAGREILPKLENRFCARPFGYFKRPTLLICGGLRIVGLTYALSDLAQARRQVNVYSTNVRLAQKRLDDRKSDGVPEIIILLESQLKNEKTAEALCQDRLQQFRFFTLDIATPDWSILTFFLMGSVLFLFTRRRKKGHF